MENDYTTEVWYPHNNGGETIEVYDRQTRMPLCTEDSKLVKAFG